MASHGRGPLDNHQNKQPPLGSQFMDGHRKSQQTGNISMWNASDANTQMYPRTDKDNEMSGINQDISDKPITELTG